MLIRLATLEDLDQLTALIQSATKHLVAKDVYQWQQSCDVEKLQNEIKNGEVFILSDHNRFVGSFSIKPSDKKYPVQMEKSFYMYRLLIHPFFQGQDMARYIFKHVRKHYSKKQHVLLDCWAGNEKLFDFYRQHECSFLGDYPAMDYKISVFQVGKAKLW